MTEDHSVYKENLAAYALGALDVEETSALEAHLRTCDECPSELAEYQLVSSGLLTAMPPRNPRPSLKQALQKRLPGNAMSARPVLNWSLNQSLLVAAFVVLIGLNIFSAYQVYSVNKRQSELNAEYSSNRTAISMLAYPSTQSVGFDENGISGSLLVDKNRNLLAVFAWHLPPTPAGKAYQMWLIDPNGDRTSGGFLVPDNDQPFVMAIVKPSQPLIGFTGFGVTLEPAGGSPKPTGPKIFRVDF